VFATSEFSRVHSKIIKVYNTHIQINIFKHAHKICWCSPNASFYIKLHINTCKYSFAFTENVQIDAQQILQRCCIKSLTII